MPTLRTSSRISSMKKMRSQQDAITLALGCQITIDALYYMVISVGIKALWALHDGDEDTMWQIIDGSVSEISSSLPINALTDTASIYYRAELAGYNVAFERWLKLSKYAADKFPTMGQSFADIHAALAHAMAGNNEYLDKLIGGNTGFAGDTVPAVASSLEGRIRK